MNDELILHIDVDAFFASVEQRLIPALRGRPVIVGCGVIASCSYEARAFGLRAGMALHEARRLCPQAVVLEGDYQIYRCFAEHIWEICRDFTCGLETYLDEAYGDATGMEGVHGPPLELGRKLQARVRDEVGLPVSIGLAANRMMAKVASGLSKPRGLSYIAPGTEEDFLAPLPIEKLPGVGRKTARLLHDLNIRTVAQLATLDRPTLAAMLGVRGELIYERCHGRDAWHGHLAHASHGHPARVCDQTRKNQPQPRQSQDGPETQGRDAPATHARTGCATPRTISRETTFHKPTCDLGEIRGMLFYLLERAMRMARSRGLAVGAVELAIRYDDWKSCDARRTLPSPAAADQEVFAVVLEMLSQLHKRRVALRHVGVTLSQFSPLASAARLFDPPEKTQRRELYRALDTIRDRFGHGAMVSGESIALLGRLEQNDYGFVLRTPSLTK